MLHSERTKLSIARWGSGLSLDVLDGMTRQWVSSWPCRQRTAIASARRLKDGVQQGFYIECQLIFTHHFSHGLVSLLASFLDGIAGAHLGEDVRRLGGVLQSIKSAESYEAEERRAPAISNHAQLQRVIQSHSIHSTIASLTSSSKLAKPNPRCRSFCSAAGDLHPARDSLILIALATHARS